MGTYKFLNRLSPGFQNNVFHKNFLNPYALRNGQELSSRNPEPVRCETETISYIAPKIGSKIPETIKMKSSLETSVCVCVCVCHFRAKYLQYVGLVNYVSTVIDVLIQIMQYSS